MEAIIHTATESVELQERQRPDPGPDEVLIEVGTAGLCGSDAHAYLYDGGYEFIQLPRVMGHEYAGRVVDTGSNVSEFSSGDSAVERPIQECGQCFQCRNDQYNVCQNFTIIGMHHDGAYTDYRVAKPEFLVPLPDDMSLTRAAITEPTSVASRAVTERSSLEPGDQVLVEGPGPIGVLTASIADANGAEVLVSGLGRDAEYRLPLVEELGIDTIEVETNDLAERRDARTNGVGFDVVFETTGHHRGVEIAADHVRKGGEIVAIGLPGEPSTLSFSDLVRGEVDVNTSYGSLTSDFRRAIQLIHQGTVDADAIIDTTYSRTDPETAINDFLESKTLKPVFSFSD